MLVIRAVFQSDKDKSGKVVTVVLINIPLKSVIVSPIEGILVISELVH